MAITAAEAPRIVSGDAKEKKLVGELWADRSEGNCIFVMIERNEFARIDAAISAVASSFC
jgi:hypothetical protein